MKTILITGGAGFIGVNAAHYFVNKGWGVTVLDNLSRKGAEENLKWLNNNSSNIKFLKADIRDDLGVVKVIKQIKPDVILHLAAQVAVTTSVNNPREDFEINALGTLNILEAIRLHSRNTFFINASTNKVYGNMSESGVVERNGRYEYQNLLKGIDEKQLLDFHSPYGCSKGVADQYTIDYSRIYNLRSVTFRQSCIYGNRQFGIEDQGWVAWFTIAALLGKRISIYGDGKQIRDVLHVEDLLRVYESAINNQTLATGQAFNVGGGSENTLSLLELLKFLEEELQIKIQLTWEDWRPGDQKVFVCNLEKTKAIFGWEPRIQIRDGLRGLINWVKDNKNILE